MRSERLLLPSGCYFILQQEAGGENDRGQHHMHVVVGGVDMNETEQHARANLQPEDRNRAVDQADDFQRQRCPECRVNAGEQYDAR